MKLNKYSILIFILLLAGIFLFAGCSPSQEETVDERLQALIADQEIVPLNPGSDQNPALVALGRALFFDKELSGNRDISCATCHHPTQNSGDNLPVSIGTGGAGLGSVRQIGYDRTLIPRNAPEVFNRGASEWHTMFWDSRVALAEDGSFISPAKDLLPAGLDNVLAVQAMFPVTSRDEMRGAVGDMDTAGQSNELADFADDDLVAIWDSLMSRLLAHQDYVSLFETAYPDVAVEALTFVQAANAIAAFEIDAYTLPQSPWQQYLTRTGDHLSEEAKKGALLFYGDAGCAGCHSGPLLTDQAHHALAVPQVGPGKGAEAPLDLGRIRETNNPNDKYCFRTPSLHNVAVTGPWMHDGAFSTLEAAVKHHLDPQTSLQQYDAAAHLPDYMQETVQNDPDLITDMLAHVDPLLLPARELAAPEIEQLLAFLESLTDSEVGSLNEITPDSVPSGLPVED